ncbi:hypothetical protein Taro_041126, partial [Colocasia esculenta]|nr:hypothetical protein [Colocasia esculenta]
MMFTFVEDIPCKTCAKNKLERSSKSQKTRYLSTTSKDLSTDTISQKAPVLPRHCLSTAGVPLSTDATSPKIKSSGRPAPVDSSRPPVERCTQTEPSAFWFFASYLRLSTAVVCYECKKQGHMRGECPELKKKLKKDKFTFKKAKAMVATWSDEDDDQNSQATSRDDEVHCLMARSDDSNE